MGLMEGVCLGEASICKKCDMFRISCEYSHTLHISRKKTAPICLYSGFSAKLCEYSHTCESLEQFGVLLLNVELLVVF